MTDAKTLGRRMRARRTELGRTLAAVAEAAGVSLPYLSNLERGRGNPTMDALARIAEALEIPVGFLLDEPPVDERVSSVESMLGTPPDSLVRFVRTEEFTRAVTRLAQAQGTDPEEMRQRLVTAMSTAPRRSNGEPTDTDWRRLLDTYSLILGSE